MLQKLQLFVLATRLSSNQVPNKYGYLTGLGINHCLDTCYHNILGYSQTNQGLQIIVTWLSVNYNFAVVAEIIIYSAGLSKICENLTLQKYPLYGILLNAFRSIPKGSLALVFTHSTLQMLAAIEGKLEELFETIESLPPDKIDAAEKSKDKERRLRLREEKLQEQRQHQEERLRRALERAQAAPTKRVSNNLHRLRSIILMTCSDSPPIK